MDVSSRTSFDFSAASDIRRALGLGVDNVMVESDYPHGDGTYPDSIKTAHSLLDGYDDDVKYKVLFGNACRVFNFEPASPGA